MTKDVTKQVVSDYVDGLLFRCECGKEISMLDDEETCPHCGAHYLIVRTLNVIQYGTEEER